MQIFIIPYFGSSGKHNRVVLFQAFWYNWLIVKYAHINILILWAKRQAHRRVAGADGNLKLRPLKNKTKDNGIGIWQISEESACSHYCVACNMCMYAAPLRTVSAHTHIQITIIA